MKKNLLVLALLGLSISTLTARHRDTLTNGRTNGTIDPKKQKQKEANRLKREQDVEARAIEKAARKEEARVRRAADREAKAIEKAAKNAEKRVKNPKYTKKQHEKLAKEHTTKAKKLAAQVQDVTDGLENLKTKRRAHVSAHLDKVANTPDTVKQSHLLNVRYATTRPARKAAAQASCEAHGTCKTAQVQDVTDAIVAQRETLTDLNAQHQQVKGKARRHHANAGTLDQYQADLEMGIAADQVAGEEPVVGDHRFSNTQQGMADKRKNVRNQNANTRKRTTASAAELQKKVRKVEAMIAQARKDKALYLANLEKKQAQTKRLAQVKQQQIQTKHLAQAQPKKWSAPKLNPIV